MKIRSAGAELFHAARQTDRHKESNSLFSQFCERAAKRIIIIIIIIIVLLCCSMYCLFCVALCIVCV